MSPLEAASVLDASSGKKEGTSEQQQTPRQRRRLLLVDLKQHISGSSTRRRSLLSSSRSLDSSDVICGGTSSSFDNNHSEDSSTPRRRRRQFGRGLDSSDDEGELAAPTSHRRSGRRSLANLFVQRRGSNQTAESCESELTQTAEEHLEPLVSPAATQDEDAEDDDDAVVISPSPRPSRRLVDYTQRRGDQFARTSRSFDYVSDDDCDDVLNGESSVQSERSRRSHALGLPAFTQLEESFVQIMRRSSMCSNLSNDDISSMGGDHHAIDTVGHEESISSISLIHTDPEEVEKIDFYLKVSTDRIRSTRKSMLDMDRDERVQAVASAAAETARTRSEVSSTMKRKKAPVIAAAAAAATRMEQAKSSHRQRSLLLADEAAASARHLEESKTVRRQRDHLVARAAAASARLRQKQESLMQKHYNSMSSFGSNNSKTQLTHDLSSSADNDHQERLLPASSRRQSADTAAGRIGITGRRRTSMKHNRPRFSRSQSVPRFLQL